MTDNYEYLTTPQEIRIAAVNGAARLLAEEISDIGWDHRGPLEQAATEELVAGVWLRLADHAARFIADGTLPGLAAEPTPNQDVDGAAKTADGSERCAQCGAEEEEGVGQEAGCGDCGLGFCSDTCAHSHVCAGSTDNN